MKWKYFLALLLAFSLLLPVYSESETELKIPELEPEAVYEMNGQDIMTLYQTINDLKNTKQETMRILENAMIYLNEYEKENKKLAIKNKLLVGGVCVSVGVSVGALIFLCIN